MLTSRVLPESRTIRLSKDSRTLCLDYTLNSIVTYKYRCHMKLQPVQVEQDVFIYDDGYYQYTDNNLLLRTDT